jgi:hypothetical protein
MHELTRRLLDESRTGPPPGRDAGGPERALALLYERLRPVIGRGGFNALLTRATRSLGDEYGELRTVTRDADLDVVVGELERVRTNGATNAEAAVESLLDALLGTLERMIGPDLTERLISFTGQEATQGGSHGQA